jgi:hypothetical protein
MGRPGRRERCRLDRTSRVSVSITDMVRSVLEGAQGFRTQTGLRRHSNQPLLAGGNSAGKEFGEARDWAAVFGDSGRFWGTETAPSRVFGRQSRGKSKTIPTTPGNRNGAGLRGGPGRTRTCNQAVMSAGSPENPLIIVAFADAQARSFTFGCGVLLVIYWSSLPTYGVNFCPRAPAEGVALKRLAHDLATHQ